MQTPWFRPACVVTAVFLLASARSGSSQSLSTPRTKPETYAANLPLPVYEVSAFHTAAATDSGDRHVWTRLNTLDIQNMPLLGLLKSAFDVPQDMILGLPEWAKHTRLDIEAKTLDEDTARLRDLTAVERRAMMLALFEERLGLKWHKETRTLPSYDLYVGKDGPKLKATAATGQNSGVSVNDTRFRLTNIPVSDLAVVLSDKLGRPVVDKTELAGRYDVALEWSSDQATIVAPDAPPPLVTVLQEQLGLKLKSGADPVQVFVIDQLTPPQAN